jgi:pyrroline-5-carboxylate reductase
MGEALVRGLLNGGWAQPDELAVVEKLPDRRASLGATLAGGHAGVRVTDRPVAADGAVVATKPGEVEGACHELARLRPPRVLSIAAGVTLSALERWLGPKPAVLRAMPNTAALVGAGAAGLAPGSAAGEDDVAWAAGVLGAVGTVVTVAEPLLDAVTGLSGSGPAYVFLLAEALIDAGVLAGLARSDATQLAAQTVLGAGRLLTESGEAPESLRAAVTSPGGTTAAALDVLEAAGFRQAVVEAVAAATARAGELGSA